MNPKTADTWIEHLGLKPHPEGGYYLETYRAPHTIPGGTLDGHFDDRSISTSIYYLLRSGDRSHFHRLNSDEIWHFYDGSSAVIHLIDANGDGSLARIGLDITRGELPQVLIPRGTWFAAEVEAPDSFILVGCTVAPGFHFDDFQLADRLELLNQFPQHREIIERLSIRSANA